MLFNDTKILKEIEDLKDKMAFLLGQVEDLTKKKEEKESGYRVTCLYSTPGEGSRPIQHIVSDKFNLNSLYEAKMWAMEEAERIKQTMPVGSIRSRLFKLQKIDQNKKIIRGSTLYFNPKKEFLEE